MTASIPASLSGLRRIGQIFSVGSGAVAGADVMLRYGCIEDEVLKALTNRISERLTS